MSNINLSEFFSGNYITADKVKAKEYLKQPMVISGIVLETIKEEKKPMIVFEGIDESLLLNKTNYLLIKATLGENSDNWVGHKITLTTGKIMFENKLVSNVIVSKVE